MKRKTHSASALEDTALGLPHRPAGRGNPAIFPDGKGAISQAFEHRASRMVKRAVTAIAEGDEHALALTSRQANELAKLRKARPWMCELADQEFRAVGRDQTSAYKKQSDLIDHENPEVAQQALRQYFNMTVPRQPSNHKIDARHLHAIIETSADDLAIAVRDLGEKTVDGE